MVAKTHRVLQMIRNGTLKPDDPRVVRLYDLASNLVSEDESSQSDSSSASSESSDDEKASSNMGHPEVAARWEREDAAALDHHSCWVNRNSGIIHHLNFDDEEKLLCGRFVSCNFRPATPSDLKDSNAVVCATCSHVLSH